MASAIANLWCIKPERVSRTTVTPAGTSSVKQSPAAHRSSSTMIVTSRLGLRIIASVIAPLRQSQLPS